MALDYYEGGELCVGVLEAARDCSRHEMRWNGAHDEMKDEMKMLQGARLRM